MPPYQRDELHSRPSNSRAPGGNATRRTWSNNGVQFTVESTSFSFPGRSFTTSGAFAESAPRMASASPQSPPRSTGVNMLGAAFNLFGDYVDFKQQQREQQATEAAKRQSGRGSSRRQYAEDTGNPADGFEDSHDSRRGTRPRGLFANFADRVADRAERTRDTPSRRERPSTLEKPRERRRRRNKSDQRKARVQEPWAGRFETRSEEGTGDELSDDPESGESDSDSIRRRESHKFPADDTVLLIEALEDAKERHRRKIRECKTQIQQASSLPTTNTATLQRLLNELKMQEEGYAACKRELQEAKSRNSSQRSAPRQSRPSTSRRSSTPAAADPLRDAFGFGDFEAFFGPRQSSYQSFADFGSLHGFSAFGAFESLFSDPVFGPKPFFGMPRGAFTGSSGLGSGFRFPTSEGASNQFPRQSNPAMFTPPKPQPPATLLHPQEAKTLFQNYNERWNALAPTDPNIPYPCRGLQARGLTARDSLWAPHLRAPIATWSEDAVMQANSQAFYLGVVGLAPTYTEALATGTIVRGFDKARATPAQVQQLIDILKKEKTRWHSDRLGRRNGGGVDAGVNETLQRDERARAVFHAVCELMEFTQ